ncbi:SpoIIE family protein phosphatase [Streptomyces olivaceiscleroticus]|uniref:SpoIIE family protein phosphatase n=1 Tax=Streptomyces olivaceiscleroticus TaxID=68245 RepID=A0ABP3LB85_9ACTN
MSDPATGSEGEPALPAGLAAGVYIQDAFGRISYVNARAEELLGRPAAELLGGDPHELLHRNADGTRLPRPNCPLLQAFLAGETISLDGCMWFARGDGELICVGGLSVPFELDGAPGGTVVLFFRRPPEEEREPADAANVAALTDLADRLTMVAETTAVLTSTLDLDESLKRLVRLVVPRLADWAVVDLLEEQDSLRRVAVVHHVDGRHVRVDELAGPMPPVLETSRMPLSSVLRGAAPRIVSPDDYAGPPDSGVAVQQREMFRAIGMRSAVIAPLRGPGKVLGALTLVRTDQETPFDAAELALVDDIARRAGLAVDNAQLYERQRRVAETMQRHLLPPLPRIEGLEMTVRYHPAPHASRVGGDWYDVFALPDGKTALVIGDVVGHDLQAAACMAQVRNMLRAFAWEHTEAPSVTVDRLDRALTHISDVQLATMILAQVERDGDWWLRWTNAGHPPPLLVHQDGRVCFLEQDAADLVLGTDLSPGRTDFRQALPPRSTVVLYTDGLIEARGLPLSEGLEQLASFAAALADRSLDEFCDQLISRALYAANEDDVALLALRVPGDG